MDQIITKDLSHFFLAGINYRKTNVRIRGLFAVSASQYGNILCKAREEGLCELFIISTCNRTEIYGFAESAEQLIRLLCNETAGNENLFKEMAYVYEGGKAVHHLYKVGAGLDSQILGDYEVISQIKTAAKFAKEQNCLGSFTERMINSVLQVSKIVKNETSLSSGTVSVAFAAVQYLKKIENICSKKILLIGAGKIGRNTCKNMIDYLGVQHVTLTNRTDAIAEAFAREHNLRFAPYDQLEDSVAQADILLVATNAPRPTIRQTHFSPRASKTILDLSVPHNVEPNVKLLPFVKVVNVDELSKVQDQTLEMRQQEIPKALDIIEEHMKDFLYWYQMRKDAVILQAVKHKLEEIHTREIKNQKADSQYCTEDVHEISSRIIQKVINMFAGKVRQANGHSTSYLQMLSELFETPVKE